MEEIRLKRIEARIKAIGVLVTLSIAAFGYWQYFEDSQLSGSKYYRERMIDHYISVTEAAASIASSENAVERDKSKDTFNSFYFGSLVLFEDENVVQKMIIFKKCMDNPCSKELLLAASLDLAKTAREHLSTSARLKLATISSPKVEN